MRQNLEKSLKFSETKLEERGVPPLDPQLTHQSEPQGPRLRQGTTGTNKI